MWRYPPSVQKKLAWILPFCSASAVADTIPPGQGATPAQVASIAASLAETSAQFEAAAAGAGGAGAADAAGAAAEDNAAVGAAVVAAADPAGDAAAGDVAASASASQAVVNQAAPFQDSGVRLAAYNVSAVCVWCALQASVPDARLRHGPALLRAWWPDACLHRSLRNIAFDCETVRLTCGMCSPC